MYGAITRKETCPAKVLGGAGAVPTESVPVNFKADSKTYTGEVGRTAQS